MVDWWSMARKVTSPKGAAEAEAGHGIDQLLGLGAAGGLRSSRGNRHHGVVAHHAAEARIVVELAADRRRGRRRARAC
jgi:hypothetical protein